MLPRILEAVDRYVDGDTSLVEFEQWFTRTAWNVSGPVGSQTVLEQLTGEIFLRIAENDLGHLPEDDLRKALASAAARARVAA